MSDAAYDMEFMEVCSDGIRRHIGSQLSYLKETPKPQVKAASKSKELSFYKRTKALKFTVKFVRQGKPVATHEVIFRSAKKRCLLDVAKRAFSRLCTRSFRIQLKGYLPHEKPRATLIIEI